MSSGDTLEQLRKQLSKALEQPKPDYSLLVELSSQLALQDQEHVRFSVDAGLISRLGEQLVERQETAVSELVKNAYDADSEWARLVFTATERAGGRLHLTDNGNGMTRDELINGFMRLASTVKIRSPRSPRYGRQRAGRKGIGRFAAQRLGTRLLLITQTADEKRALRVEIDWRDFKQDRNLFAIANRIQHIAKERPRGTTLIIDGLRETWTDPQIQRVYRYVQDLVQPFPLVPVEKDSKSKRDPGFSVTMSRLVGAKEIEVAGQEKMVFRHSVGKVSGAVDENGFATWTIESDRFNIHETEPLSASKKTPRVPFSALRNVNFSAHYFIWDEELVPALVFSALRELVRSRGGVRLYRNGFRVLPYGEPDNDWLGLDETSRKRAVLPAIANINWIGFVEIRDPEGRYFEETSSREGLLRNHAYDELVDFVLRSFKEATLRVATARGRKGKAGKNRKDALPPMERLKEVAVDLEALAEKMQRAAAKRGDVAAPEASVLRDVARRVKLEAAASAELIQELAMLRVLSGLGLTIGMYSHEVSHRLLSLGGRIHELAESLPPNARTTKLLKETAAHVQLLESYTAYFDTAVSENIRRELAPQPLGTILWDFVRELKPILERDNIVFSDPDIREDQGLETRPMHPSEWTSILMNLLTNSVKAIRRNPRPRTGKLLLKAWREEATIFVDFADNGVGIPEKIHERIFDAFFTTTSDDSPDGLRGTGLGLKIVRDIVMAAGGQIYVTPPPASYSTCFRIEIPANPERRRK